MIPSISRRAAAFLLASSALVSFAAAEWPAFRHDAGRSGYTAETLPESLSPAWVFQAPAAPRPAWPRSRRMTFDRAFQTVIAEGLVFFGSSADGVIYALDESSGTPRWTFPTGAPVRFAPTWSGGRLFAASDDGFLYCLKAKTGELEWKKRGGPDDRLILGNGRLVSRWPVRGGPVVRDDIVYFASGIWPSDGVSLYALETKTGETIWVNDTSGSIYMGQPHGGAFAKSGVAAQGFLAVSRERVFMATGRAVPASFNRTNGEFEYFHLQANTKLGGADIVLTDRFFVNSRYAFDRETGTETVKLPEGPVVATPDGLVVCSPGEIVGLEWADKETVDRKGKSAKTRGLNETFSIPQDDGSASAIVAGSRLFIGGENQVRAVALDRPAGLWRAAVNGTVYGLAAAAGRLIVSTDEGAIHCFAASSRSAPEPRKEAEPPPRRTGADDPYAELADEILESGGVTEGYCLDLGCGDGRLALELAKRSELFVYAMDADPENVAAARRRFIDAGIYGSRAMALQGDLEDTRLPPYFANLIVSSLTGREPLSKPARREADRALRPWGGVLVTGPAGSLKVTRRGALEGAGNWTHQYADPANTVNSADELIRGPLGMLWFNDLGQDMTQRHGRGPAPLFNRGVLYSEGLDGLMAVDAYNGRKIWEYPLPGILTAFDGDHLMGTSGTGSNYCVTGDSVYVRRENYCLRIDAHTGKLISRFEAPLQADGGTGIWGYIAAEDGILFGSLADREHVVTYRFRPGGDMNEQLTESSTLFALDAVSGKMKWRYDAEHSIRHNSISIGPGAAVLIDRPLAEFDRSRDGKPSAENHPTGELVALSATTGKILWRNTEDIYGTLTAISPKHEVVLMGYQPTRFRLASEVGGRISVYRLADGKLLWEKRSEYSSRPTINDRTIYAQDGAWDLMTGDERPFNFKRSYGCGVLAGSRDLLCYRSATLGYFDLTKNEENEDYGGIRPGCWINVIPAGGLVFAPDASAGCKCSYLNQSWIALQPAPGP